MNVNFVALFAVVAMTLLGQKKAKAMTPAPKPTPGPGPTVPATLRLGPIVSAFPETDHEARNRMVLDAVRAGREDPIAWAMVTSLGTGPLAGYELDVPVMADALKIEGIRISTSYETAQWIADALSARSPADGALVMLTPWLDAIVFENADAPLAYTTSQELSNKAVTPRTSQMVEVSQKVDRKLEALRALGTLPPVPLVANVGKNWVLTRRFLEPGVHPETNVPHAQAAANQGFYPPKNAYNPIQYRGVAHNLKHVDYSQVLRFLGPVSYLREPGVERDQPGIPIQTSQLLQDENLGPLLSGQAGLQRGKMVGEGFLPFDRHPAVPELGKLV